MLRIAKWVSLPSLMALPSDDGTDVTEKLNKLIEKSTGDVYTGGTGLIVRAPDFITGGGFEATPVVPASFWHNDISAPSQFYPHTGNVWAPLPNDNWDGFYNTPFDPQTEIAPWTYASVGVVVGGSLNKLYPDDFDNIQSYDWGWGVFYPTDSNAVDKRCRWRGDHDGYDCPGGWMDSTGLYNPDSDHKGAGSYQSGNPDAYGDGDYDHGGGSGCHFDTGAQGIDQPDQADWEPNNVVKDAHCQCNDALRGDNQWADWFDVFATGLKQKSGFEDRAWLDAGGALAPSWAADASMCWVSNPRDLIMIQNQMYWQRQRWNNALIPKTDFTSTDSSEMRKYWGWNEIPVSREIVEDHSEWDSIMIKLPADVCNSDMGAGDTVKCLGTTEAADLESQLDDFVTGGKLVPGLDNIGKRPGSYVVFAREWGQTSESSTGSNLGSSFAGVNWQRWFFCEDWTSPSGKYKIVHNKPSDDVNGNGACFIDWGGSPTPSPGPSPTPPSVAPDFRGDNIVHMHSQKCLGVANFDNGNPIIVSACDGSDTQGWTFDSWPTLTTTRSGTPKCVDSPGTWDAGNSLQIWDCNASPQQFFGFGEWDAVNHAGTIFASDSSDASLCMDVQNAGDLDENLVWLWDCYGGDNQLFQPLKVPADIFA